VGVQVLIRYGEQHLQNVAQKPKINYTYISFGLIAVCGIK
jgi:hypothetical protein